ncbi:DUF397 domain-containing protein [Streptomyces kaniharaensis]|uniref:DUF397 domain-containing protein n=1 Tax=Streptomyces kaniharaensis TaxID=212423 RepID=A0A6N7KR47_9ACTN|nr:DUF397 domain-containing protein [Streptomyces kaniharaensis]MQS13039.1 DUF397 domain-containing protein [Streptomyces kaniharaensis]
MSDWQRPSLSSESDVCLEVRTVDGMVEIRESDTTEITVRTTPKKWEAFLLGVQAGEFDHLVADAE